MTIKEFQENFYPPYEKALSFVNCFNNALEKCDDNTRKQMEIIGWDENTKAFLLDALRRIEDMARYSYRWEQAPWWKE